MGSLPDVFIRAATSNLFNMSSRPKSVSETELQKQKESMNKTETKEMQRLPTADDIAQEKTKLNLNEQIQNVNKESLKKTETEEKVRLPTIEDIEAEKKAEEEES